MPDVLDSFKELRAFQGCSVIFQEVSGGLDTFLGFCGVAGGFEGFRELFMGFQWISGELLAIQGGSKGVSEAF